MDPTDTNEINAQLGSTEPETPQGEELNHSDKMIGVFTEPGKTFNEVAKFPPRNKDWVIPILILFILIGITRSISMMNSDVFFDAKQKQVANIEKMVEDGTLTREQGDNALEGIDSQMEMMRGPVGWVINIVSVLIFGFIFFFIIAGIFLVYKIPAKRGWGVFFCPGCKRAYRLYNYCTNYNCCNNNYGIRINGSGYQSCIIIEFR